MNTSKSRIGLSLACLFAFNAIAGVSGQYAGMDESVLDKTSLQILERMSGVASAGNNNDGKNDYLFVPSSSAEYFKLINEFKKNHRAYRVIVGKKTPLLANGQPNELQKCHNCEAERDLVANTDSMEATGLPVIYITNDMLGTEWNEILGVTKGEKKSSKYATPPDFAGIAVMPIILTQWATGPSVISEMYFKSGGKKTVKKGDIEELVDTITPQALATSIAHANQIKDNEKTFQRGAKQAFAIARPQAPAKPAAPAAVAAPVKQTEAAKPIASAANPAPEAGSKAKHIARDALPPALARKNAESAKPAGSAALAAKDKPAAEAAPSGVAKADAPKDQKSEVKVPALDLSGELTGDLLADAIVRRMKKHEDSSWYEQEGRFYFNLVTAEEKALHTSCTDSSWDKNAEFVVYDPLTKNYSIGQSCMLGREVPLDGPALAKLFSKPEYSSLAAVAVNVDPKNALSANQQSGTADALPESGVATSGDAIASAGEAALDKLETELELPLLEPSPEPRAVIFPELTGPSLSTVGKTVPLRRAGELNIVMNAGQRAREIESIDSQIKAKEKEFEEALGKLITAQEKVRAANIKGDSTASDAAVKDRNAAIAQRTKLTQNIAELKSARDRLKELFAKIDVSASNLEARAVAEESSKPMTYSPEALKEIDAQLRRVQAASKAN